jgi:hypothetical protein
MVEPTFLKEMAALVLREIEGPTKAGDRHIQMIKYFDAFALISHQKVDVRRHLAEIAIGITDYALPRFIQDCVVADDLQIFNSTRQIFLVLY